MQKYLSILGTQFLYSYSVICKKGYTVCRSGSKLCQPLSSRTSPCELTQARRCQRNQSQLQCRPFLCALILKQSIGFDTFQLIGIFLDILWGFQSRLKGFLKDDKMKLLYLLFPLQLLLRKLAPCQESRTNNTRLLPWVSNQTSDNVLCLRHPEPPQKFFF